TDITANLDREKADPVRRARIIAEAEATISGTGVAAAQQLVQRARARAASGRVPEATKDVEEAIKLAKAANADYVTVTSRMEQLLLRYIRSDPKRAIALIESMIKQLDNNAKGRLFDLNHQLVIVLLSIGDINRAENVVKQSRALQGESRNWKGPYVDLYRSSWASDVEGAAARVYDARGRNADAEASYRKSRELMVETIRMLPKWPNKISPDGYENSIDWAQAFEGRAKARQGRVTEAEADIRRALIGRLSRVGKYNGDTAGVLGIFSWMLAEQGRYVEAEKVTREIEAIYRQLGFPEDSRAIVNTRVQLANALNSQRRFEESAEVYRGIDAATAKWDPKAREATINSSHRVNALLNSNNTTDADAVEMSRKFYEINKARLGERNLTTAVARGYIALSLMRTGKLAEAAAEYRATIPLLMELLREGDDEDGATAVAREARVRGIVEGYLFFLSRNPQYAASDIGEETFRLADVVRGQAVERALSASSARAAAKDPALAELVRKEQDFGKQISAVVGTLNNMLASLPEERDEASLKTAQASLVKLKAEHSATSKNIAKRFPNYAELVEPPPVTSAEIRQFLRDEEAFLSFYFGRNNSFVWVVPKQGKIQFRRIDMQVRDINAKVSMLRESLEPQAAMISDIPEFNLRIAYELYEALLKPVEEGWKGAKSLVVVTNGSLGLLPLSLLPTAPATVDQEKEPMFSGYRDVAWLARTHAVTVIPSANALRTLRRTPPVTAKRELMIGFGDPLFSKEQAAEATKPEPQATQVAMTTRGLPLRRRASPQFDGAGSAGLAQLPRLPDTADELKSIALALQADPSKVLNLGVQANEQMVKTADLSKYKILVFATHGLVPGELDGLTQPALALSAPDVSGSGGDGLLTMEEILGLKLNADWVVLSACNTGAGSGAGAEAASGLGRAFFYAGTRALLVTNWSVHSQSARELTSDLFRRQAADPKLSRSEALRQAMIALIDGDGSKDEKGATQFSYAHPLFWAPFTIIGDGG
ncbi:MAG TPA: CHAT domain-containing protein, partial [Xanthobacteraceae bacterium]|nr:CHAT domain-containing protein [Xanthobacteraceae bacterium]